MTDILLESKEKTGFLDTFGFSIFSGITCVIARVVLIFRMFLRRLYVNFEVI